MPGYQAVFLPEAEKDIERLDSPLRNRCPNKIEWLSRNPDLLGRKPLQNLPRELKGLCSYTVGDWRILYWVYPGERLLKIYGIQHRSKVYKHL